MTQWRSISSSATPSTPHRLGHCTCLFGQWKRSCNLLRLSGPILTPHHMQGRVHTFCSWCSRSSKGTFRPQPKRQPTGLRRHSSFMCVLRSFALISLPHPGNGQGTPRHLHFVTSCLGNCVTGSWAPHPSRQEANLILHRKLWCADICGSSTWTPHNLQAFFRAGHSVSLCCCKYLKGKVPPQLSHPVGRRSHSFNMWYVNLHRCMRPAPHSRGHWTGAWPRSNATNSCLLCNTRCSAISSTLTQSSQSGAVLANSSAVRSVPGSIYDTFSSKSRIQCLSTT